MRIVTFKENMCAEITDLVLFLRWVFSSKAQTDKFCQNKVNIIQITWQIGFLCFRMKYLKIS